jgi:hypothetical protein
MAEADDELDEVFSKIALDAIIAAEGVGCSFAEFVEGLRTMALRLGDRYAEACEEERRLANMLDTPEGK